MIKFKRVLPACLVSRAAALKVLNSWNTDFITSRWVRLQASIIIDSILTGGGVSLLVERAAGAAEAGDHGEDEDGAGGAHDDPDPHRQTEKWMVLIHRPRKQGKITEICHSLLDLRLDDLVLLGAAVLVVLGAATEYVLWRSVHFRFRTRIV